ncbi:Phosphatidylinositol 4-5-bisphosphate-binding protein SLM1 [Apiospora kogelbergensis]|uniref:Phosphatidylinositol 4-5-bisphosphate-binding protein SLM1 n=1 Tax=Apiospora kogelbergensis TaxID=1337665 RepID=UPI00313210ED
MATARSPLSQQRPRTPLNNTTVIDPAGPPAVADNSYFQYHQPQPQYSAAQRVPADQETASNTLANAQLASPSADNNSYSRRDPKFTEEWDASVRGSSIIEGPTHRTGMQRSNSTSSRPGDNMSVTGDGATSGISLSRGNTLKKKSSLRRSGSLKRSGSRRSMKAGSVRSLALQSSHDPEEALSAFYCPVPTTGNPTEVLANRFQSWRKILKDLIAYFREIQSHYEHRSKSLLKLANVANNMTTPPGFLASGGLDDAVEILRTHHKQSIIEANKAREIEEDVILALTGLRSDLNMKMKEIKSLSGDFRNSVDKEMENTRRAVNTLQEVLGQTEMDSSLTTGKQDPYLLRLAVDRQVERQIDEETYLHQAYLNLETSGRELESIVVGEIQKSYNAYAGILKREADGSYNTIEDLRVGPIAMPKDHEWHVFVQKDAQFVNPDLPIRSPEHIHYPGRDHYASQEIRAGLLERKSKYLKSYTAGWYVLSPTHLHEFKSADKSGPPVVSLYLPEQKLGSHSTEGGSSNKFVLKGRQTGTMHRGHTWVFRAESHDTMMAWYEDIKALTEKSPEERNHFVQGHVRTLSRSSQRSISSDGMVDDEDEEPFVSHENAAAVVASPGSRQDSVSSRPQPGGRFPSDIQVNAERGMQVPHSPSDASSGFLDNSEYAQGAPVNGHVTNDYEAVAAASALPGSQVGEPCPASQVMVGQNYGRSEGVHMDVAPSHAEIVHNEAVADGVNPYNGEPALNQHSNSQFQQRFFAAPSAIAGPRHVNLPQHTSISEDPSNAASYNSSAASPTYYENEFLGQAPLMNAQAGNGASSMGVNRSSAYGQVQQQQQSAQVSRPGFQGRTDSTPHVPGEYPRGTPATTPAY